MATERDRAVVAGATLRVAGRLRPGVAGERVVVRVRRGGRKIAVKAVKVDKAGAYRLRIRAGGTGTVTVSASHRRTAALGTAVARPLRVDVLPRRVAGGQRGRAVRLLQRHLRRRGYVVGRAGTFDARTSRAVLAFRKVSGLRRTSAADTSVMRRLASGGGRFKVRFPSHGKHVEADLSRQVLALIRGSRVERIYHTSSGSPATPTIRGSFRFYLSQPGYNSKEMFWSRYFIRGYAIHGYKSVPVYPASHGCLRVPIADARSIHDWVATGDRIDVYR
jgi:L,D-transpeptidase catalytic domain/Putative peptidoglycan binding domain